MVRNNKIKNIHFLLSQASNKRKNKRAKAKAKIIRIERNTRKKIKSWNKRERKTPLYSNNRQKTLIAPTRFSLLKYPEDVICFITKVHSCAQKPYVNSIRFDLDNIQIIDIGAICLLLSKLNELTLKNIKTWGSFPKNSQCKTFIKESGFLDRMCDLSTRKMYQRDNKNLILNRGFDLVDNAATAKEIRKAVSHLTGSENNYQPLYSVAQEICANSVEHANEKTEKKNWIFSTRYEEDSVTFIMIDIGEGILETIKRKLFDAIKEKIKKEDNVDFLTNAFSKKYGSRTRDTNRNKGLPKIFKTQTERFIYNLIVITNNVLLDFDNPSNSRVLNKSFKGTLYYWKLNKDCIDRWKNRLDK